MTVLSYGLSLTNSAFLGPIRIAQGAVKGFTSQLSNVGPYAELEAQEPAIGSAFSGYPDIYRVSEVSLEDTGGGSGRMMVTIERPQPDNSAAASPDALADPIYESDYAEERRPLEEHKKCGELKADRPYYKYPDRKTSTANPKKTAAEADSDPEEVYKQRTWENWHVLDADDYDHTGYVWSLVSYKSLKEKGFNDYPICYPVCTETTYHRYRPSSGAGVNAISTPPSACNPPTGFIYVKSGDRCTKQGRLYTRVQSWRGYNSADALFYL